MITKPKKTWKQTIQPHINKYDKTFKKMFADFEKEKKSKGIKTLSENNKLWNEKYKSKFDKLMTKHDAEYKKIWTNYHNK